MWSKGFEYYQLRTVELFHTRIYYHPGKMYSHGLAGFGLLHQRELHELQKTLAQHGIVCTFFKSTHGYPFSYLTEFKESETNDPCVSLKKNWHG